MFTSHTPVPKPTLIHTYTCIHSYPHTHVHTYNKPTNINTRTPTSTQTQTHLCMYMYIHMHVYFYHSTPNHCPQSSPCLAKTPFHLQEKGFFLLYECVWICITLYISTIFTSCSIAFKAPVL